MPKKKRESKYKLRRESVKLLNDTVAELRETDEEERNKLRREVRKTAMNRIEKAARTQADLEVILNLWDLFEENYRKWEEEYITPLYTLKTDSESGEVEEIDEVICKTDKVFPIPYSQTLRTRYWRHVLSGDFLDTINDCAYFMHESVSHPHVSVAISRLTDTQKEVLYSFVIEEKSAQQVAKSRGCTQRNVNKVYVSAIKSIRKYVNAVTSKTIVKITKNTEES